MIKNIYTVYGRFISTKPDKMDVLRSMHYSTPYIYFVDVDECTDDTDDCDDNAVCTNTVGSYACHCKPGYSGDGVTCNGK